MNSISVSAVILAGGESSRMGRDKAWMEVEGQPLITRALGLIRAMGINELFVSGRAGADYSALGVRVLLDSEPGAGPLAGIERGLEASQAPLVLVLAVDMPRMTAPFLRKLVRHSGPLTGVVPELRGQLEPLAAVYPKRCQLLARDCLGRGRLAARDFAAACLLQGAVRTFVVPHGYAGCFGNWNTPSDVAAGRAEAPLHGVEAGNDHADRLRRSAR